jgi:N-acetylglucosamine-6-sulfatase
MAATQPNFVVVITDDMRDSDWQALGKTRSLVADRGTTFPNFFLTTPICAPSRASILTGMYPHNHGVVQNDGKRGGVAQFAQKEMGDNSVAAAVRDAGYRTGLFGKFMNGISETGEIPGGWNQWLVSSELAYYNFTMNDNGSARRYSRPDDYSTDVIRDRAIEFVRSTESGRPLLLFFTPKAPHGPATPARRDRRTFGKVRVERSPDLNEVDVGDKPAYIRRNAPYDLDELDALNRKRLDSLVAVDDAVEALVGALSETDRLANTYIFVLSDNGYMLGSHRLLGKGAPYRHATQVRMAVNGPAFEGGGVRADLAANIDVAPTIAALAGVQMRKADGVSLLEPARRDAVLLRDFAGRSYRAVRTARYLYVENDGGERELYDYAQDPYELDNLLADWEGHSPAPGAEAIAAGLQSRLKTLDGCAEGTCR